MQLLIENGYITSYVIIGSITNGIEFDERDLPTDFFNQFEPNKYIMKSEGKVALSEEYEEKENIYIPSNIEIQAAQAQMQVTKTANQLMKSQKEQAALAMELVKKEQRLKQNEIIQAQTMKELTAKEQRLKDMETQQAKAMLEITKMKGSN